MIRNRERVEPYMTRDKSIVWELYHPGSSPARGFSVAEACVESGEKTDRHAHRRSQEIYYILEGTGTMRLGEEAFAVNAGDAVLIPPGTPHDINADSNGRVRILCICSPQYEHEDTEIV